MTDSKDAALQQGLLLALIAFCGFPIGDTLIKSLAGEWPALAVAALRFWLGTLIFTVIVLWRLGPAGLLVRRPLVHFCRGCFLTLATATFFSALYLLPLADAAAIQFINPLLTALAGAWLLGERLNGAGWSAILLGFVGVLVMLRPAGEAYGLAALLPLASAFGVTGLIVLNRIAATQSSIWTAQLHMAFWAACLLSLLALGTQSFGGAFAVTAWPGQRVLWTCVIVSITAGTCHYLLYAATERAGASAIAPIVYVQLPVATLLSVLVFADPIDTLTLLGGGLILSSGLILWLGNGGWRQLRRALGR